jgi:hypothetical protein
MGHLVTVQNLLKALGSPLNLDREDYPWGSDFYPFEFTLQRFALPSLAKYVCAESPVDWSGPEADEIKQIARVDAGTEVNQVGALYGRLLEILSNKALIPDTAFQSQTLPYQASWEEWGRGYRLGDRGQESGNVPAVRAPDRGLATIDACLGNDRKQLGHIVCGSRARRGASPGLPDLRVVRYAGHDVWLVPARAGGMREAVEAAGRHETGGGRAGADRRVDAGRARSSFRPELTCYAIR